MTLFHGLGHVASGRLRSQPGMVLLTPTSIAHSGTSASIGANGQVTFTAVTSLSLNGVFSATYDNYIVAYQALAGVGNANLNMRLRVSGSDNSTANSYVYQYISADNTTIAAERLTGDVGSVGNITTTTRSGWTISFYGPFLAQPTAYRSVGVLGLSSAYFFDRAGTHNQSTSYDGFTVLSAGGSVTSTGTIAVYGVRS